MSGFRRRHDGGAEQLYRDGVAVWAAGDLVGAIELLDQALAAGDGPDDDPWWFAASRARAQVAMAQDDLATAGQHLGRLAATPLGAAQTLVLRGRLALLRGDHDSARREVDGAVARIADDADDDLGSLMNGAIALVEAADVLVELGDGQDAAALISAAVARVREAGVEDPDLAAWAILVGAGAARLLGDPDASRHLDRVDAGRAAELPVRVARERARAAFDTGDRAAAARHYDDAIAAAAAHGEHSMVRMLQAERAGTPPVRRTGSAAPDPAAGEQLGYGVVLTLTVDRPLDQFFALDAAVCAVVDARPELGLVDGNGTDGEVFELFLDGVDPEQLWDAVRPLVDDFRPGPGSRVTISPVDAEPQSHPLP